MTNTRGIKNYFGVTIFVLLGLFPSWSKSCLGQIEPAWPVETGQGFQAFGSAGFDESEDWERNAGEDPQEPISLPVAAASLDQIELSLRPKHSTPTLRPLPGSTSVTTAITPKSCCWTAPDVTYKNLMFEEPLLERHGITGTGCYQSFVSGFRFFARGLVAPLDLIKGHHKRCDNPLGWGTPGSYCR